MSFSRLHEPGKHFYFFIRLVNLQINKKLVNYYCDFDGQSKAFESVTNSA